MLSRRGGVFFLANLNIHGSLWSFAKVANNNVNAQRLRVPFLKATEINTIISFLNKKYTMVCLRLSWNVCIFTKKALL